MAHELANTLIEKDGYMAGADESLLFFHIQLLGQYRSAGYALDYLDHVPRSERTRRLVWACLEQLAKNGSLQGAAVLKEHIMAAVENNGVHTPAFYCNSCGFEGRLHHWQCPGCSHWGTCRPVEEKHQVTQGAS